jgi:UTP--glucose-1-phosphate uridylyltransferase
MVAQLRTIITANTPAMRDQSLEAFCRAASLEELLAECVDLDRFRRECENLYERVRALFFLYAIHRFYLPARPDLPRAGRVSARGHERLLLRRFEEAVSLFLAEQMAYGPSDTLCSALASAYHALAFQTLANQVRRSVRSVPGNQWMFRLGHPADHPLRLRPELLRRGSGAGPFPILAERTPVRMDLSHSAWSDIFFLGMDFPEGARVLNISIDLAVLGRDASPHPPIEVYLRVIDEPILRLISVDLGASADVTNLAEVFDFARDYLGLLKAAVIAAGIVPPGLEGSEESLTELLARVVGPGLGLEIVSSVNNIPKGSRLAVSTNLLASLIAACMRATGQAHSLTGSLREDERRLVAARAILGEWLGGSGGGWQDSGGVWPGIKLIEGQSAAPGDPEHGVSRGRLLPRHKILEAADAPAEARQGLQESLVLVHGGMAQNVGPILEMVTEKYLLRSEPEWQARRQALGILDEILAALRTGDVRAVGGLTTRNFEQPIQTIIPWASNHYTETLIERVRRYFGSDFWGFWMLGGMSGGGMGFLVAPRRKSEAQHFLLETMTVAKRELQHSLPFAMDPVVYDFAINDRGTSAALLQGGDALLPPAYYALQVPHWLRQDPRSLTPQRRVELDRLGAACRSRREMAGMAETLFDRLLPPQHKLEAGQSSLEALLQANGFDPEQHERVRGGLRRGLIGLAQNRLPATAVIEDVRAGDVLDAGNGLDANCTRIGRGALAKGAVAVITLAAGAGSRWTQGAGVVKALHPFCRLGGRHRTFLEVHLAKSRRVSQDCGSVLPHVVTTGYLTHKPVEAHLHSHRNYGYTGPVHLSPGRSVGLRLVPMARDLRFAWEEMPQQLLDEQAQKVRDSLRAALLDWACKAGEGSDYTDNLPLQCLHPVGHWYEIPNLFRNGVLQQLLVERPQLRYLMVHNIDTLGADVDAALLGAHIDSGRCLTYEVIPRRIDDRGGGLARVDGRVRLVEGLALPREEDEFKLTYYNALTTWVDVDQLLTVFCLTRDELADASKVAAAIRRLSGRVPTYITLKEVKKRWGHGQEDVFPVCQFEKLWGDMTGMSEVDCGFVVVPRLRGQQLKEQAQLDGWLRDGSAAYVESICAWE